MQTGQQDNQPVDGEGEGMDKVTCPECGCEFSASQGGEKEPASTSEEGSTTSSGEPSIIAKLMSLKNKK
jgi:hypothetical protein